MAVFRCGHGTRFSSVATDAGVLVTCPTCGQPVMQKAMIPMAFPGGQGVRYACIDCARKDVVIRLETETDTGSEA